MKTTIERKGMTLIELLAVCALVVIILVVAYQFFGPDPLPPAPPGAKVPTHFEIQQQAGFVTTLDVVSGGQRYGTISRDGSFWTSFSYQNAQGQTLAKASKIQHLWGVELQVKDGAGRALGSLYKKMWHGSWTSTVYAVLDASGREIATSEKVDFFSTNITLKDNSGRVIATLSRPGGQFKDNWTVDIHKPGVIDDRILIAVAAFKTHADDSK